MMDTSMSPPTETISQPETEITPTEAQNNEPWQGNISDESLRNNQQIQNLKSIDDLAKGYVHAQSMLGKDRVILPGDGSTDDDWNIFYKGIGRPDSPDGYTLPEIEGADSDGNKTFAQMAHSAGLTNKQAQSMYDGLYKIQNEQQEIIKQEQAKSQAELVKMYGENYNSNMSLKDIAMNKICSPELIKWLNESGMSKNHHIVDMFVNAGKYIGETSLPSGQPVKTDTMTPEEASAEINKLLGDKTFAEKYYSANHPQHDEAVRRINSLYQLKGASNV